MKNGPKRAVVLCCLAEAVRLCPARLAAIPAIPLRGTALRASMQAVLA